MVFRRVQVLFVGLIAISALERSANLATQAEATVRANRLAKITHSAQRTTP